MDLSECRSSARWSTDPPDESHLQPIEARDSHLLAVQDRVLHAFRLPCEPFACSAGLQIKLEEIWTA